jgi:hypothetical protein
MLRALRAIGWTAALLLLGAAIAFAVRDSSAFQECMADPGHQTGAQQYNKGTSEFVRTLIPRIHIGWRCTWHSLDKNGAGITAVLTLVLAVSTVLLWMSTRDLARGAERALTELERPFVYVEVLTPGLVISGVNAGFAGSLQAICANYGRTPADLWELEDQIVFLPKGGFPEPMVPKANPPRQMPPGAISAPAKPYPFDINLRGWLNMDQLAELGQGRGSVFLIGYVRYLDIFNRRHITGFCAYFDPVSQRFVARGDERYSYTRDE